MERHPDERRTVSAFFDLATALPESLARTHLPGHFTASAWVLAAEGDAVLLTHHRKLDRWLQLGGHADGDPDLPAVARREAWEEAGITGMIAGLGDEWRIFDLDVHEIPAFADVPEHLHYDVRFLFRAAGAHAPVVSDESHDVRWVALDSIAAYSDDRSVLRMARKTRELR